ncbi:MAG: nucleoside deaminase [Candidatus Woesearchaeota archaeon]
MDHPNEQIMRELIEFTVEASGRQRTGCFIVKGDEVISRAVSTVEEDQDPTAHGEMNAVRALCRNQKNYHLKDCWVYSTQIPCPMCTSALVWAEAKGVVYGWDGRHTWGKLDIDPRTILRTAKRPIQVFGPFLENECLRIDGYEKK